MGVSISSASCQKGAERKTISSGRIAGESDWPWVGARKAHFGVTFQPHVESAAFSFHTYPAGCLEKWQTREGLTTAGQNPRHC